jgi:hypothetical protein
MEYKYSCDKCKFYTNMRSLWYKHTVSGLHMEGHRATRCDKKLLDICPNCDYTTKNNISMQTHILNNHSTKEDREKQFKKFCKYCDFGTFNEKQYDNHLETKKHKLIMKIFDQVKNESSKPE